MTRPKKPREGWYVRRSDGPGNLRPARWPHLFGALVFCLTVVTSCSGPGLDLTDADYLNDVTGASLELGSRIELAKLGHQIGFPTGWYAESAGPFTSLAWNRAEVRRWFDGRELEGPLVFFEVETFEFMEGMGLDEQSPTPEDLLDFSVATFGWADLRQRQSLTLFGGEGIQVRGTDPRGEFLGIVGVLPEEKTILIMVIAPTASILDDLMPTWRAMAQSLVGGLA